MFVFIVLKPIFLENGFFSHLIHPSHISPPFIVPCSPHTDLPTAPDTSPSILQGRAGLQEMLAKQDKTGYKMTWQKPS